MHAAAFDFVFRHSRLLGPRKRVLEIGACDVNGSVRQLFAGAEYLGLDCRPGPGVDVVADAASWRPEDGAKFDTVVSTECLEHALDPAAICRTAHEVLVDGGVLILTAAGPGREPHSADGSKVEPGEVYGNIYPEQLRIWLAPFGVPLIQCHEHDIYALAVKLAR